MSEKTPMSPAAASRIQSAADRTSTNQDFKARAQSAAANNTNQVKGSSGSTSPAGGQAKGKK